MLFIEALQTIRQYALTFHMEVFLFFFFAGNAVGSKEKHECEHLSETVPEAYRSDH